MRKAEYVRNAKQARAHTCHWPGCGKQVPPAMWGCLHHWKKLPRDLRMRIWGAYRPGQEEDLDVSSKYIEVARETQEWIRTYLEREAKLSSTSVDKQ